MENIVEYGKGILIYLAQEGRGHGIQEKINSLNYTINGDDSFTAFSKMGIDLDKRNYQPAVKILNFLEVNLPIVLLTNNPHKAKSLRESGIDIQRLRSLYIPPTNQTIKIGLEAKRDQQGHILPDSIEIDN